MDAAGERFFVSGGTLPADTASYLERGADKALLNSLRSGSFCYVLNSRQLGKSSLSVHTIARLEEAGIRTAFLDLTRIGGKNLNAEQWYVGLAFELGRELKCVDRFRAYWKQNTHLAPVQRFFGAIRDIALDGEGAPLVIFIDEIDATRSLPFDADEFFAAIRECFNRRVADPALQRLSFCLLGVAVPSDLVRNRATTPFNIGERIYLEDFTAQELAPFQTALGPNGAAVVRRVHYWTDGHPFLSQSLCQSIAALGNVTSPKAVDEVVRRELFDYKARESNINLADVANIALHYEDMDSSFRADLLSTYLRILEGEAVQDDESNRVMVVLKLSGIVKGDGRRLRIRNRIYKHVFDRTWIEEHMPAQELRRQRHSYLRGAWRTAIALGAIVAVVGGLAAFAWMSRMQAVAAKGRLDRELYVSDMNSLRGYFEIGDTARIEQILARYQNTAHRGFEWGYWLGRFHDAAEEYTLAYKAPGKREIGHISANGREIAIEDQLSRTATIIDRASKQTLATVPLGLKGEISSTRNGWVTIDRNNDRVAFGDPTGKLKLREYREHNRFPAFVRHNPHSDYALVGVSEGVPSSTTTRLILWNIAAGKNLREFANDPGSELLAMTNDARVFVHATGSYEKGLNVEVLSLADNRPIDRFKAPYVKNLAFSRTGDWILMQTNDGKRLLRRFAEHRSFDVTGADGPMLDDAFTLADDKRIVGLLTGGRCCIKRVSDGETISEIRGIFSVSPGPTPTDEFLASASTVRVFSGSAFGEPKISVKGVRVTRYTKDVLNIFEPSQNAIQRISEKTLATVGNVPKGQADYSLGYNGHWQLYRDAQGRSRILHSTDGQAPDVTLPFAPANWSCGLRSDNIACWSPGESLAVVSGQTGKIRWSLPNYLGAQGMWMSPDSKRLIVVRNDVEMTIFDADTGHPLVQEKAHNVGPLSLNFSADGSRFFTCGGDGRVVMWDLASLRKLGEFRGNDQERMTSADLSPDGRRVATTDTGGSWQLWDAQSGVQLLNIAASGQSLSSAIFCLGGQRILTAGADGIVRSWTAVDRDPTTYVEIDPKYLSNLKP